MVYIVKTMSGYNEANSLKGTSHYGCRSSGQGILAI
jgi:hypothetical protein